MRRVVFVLMAASACAPKGDYTPRIDVEPQAERRLCYVSAQAERRDAGRWPADVESACAELRSDLRGPPRIIWIDAPDE
jgi:hypothetical protein